MMSIFRISKVQLAVTLFLIFLTALETYPSFVAVRIVILSLLFTIGTDLSVTFIRKRALFVPYAALVTGLILSLTLNPHLQWYEILLVAFISMGAKNFLRISNHHIFNPAGIGLIIGGILLHQNVSWWGVSFQTLTPFGIKHTLFFLILLLPLLVSAYRMRRYGNTLSFLITYTLLLLILNHFNFSILQTILFDPTVIFFSIVMLPEPMTTPNNPSRQLLFGVLVATAAALISLIRSSFTPDPLIMGLLVGNLLFFRFR